MATNEDTSNTLSYPIDGNNDCFAIEEESFWFQERNRIIEFVIKKFRKSGSVADVGGGNGFVTLLLSRLFGASETTLVEPGLEGCKNAKIRGIENIFNGTIESYSNTEFDNICLFDVIEHIENPEEFLQTCTAKLKSKGKIFLTVPAHNYLMSIDDIEGGHYIRYDQRQIEKLIASQRNLKIVYSSYFFLSLVPLIFFIKSIPFRLGIARSSAAVSHHQSSLASRLIRFVLKMEYYLLFTKGLIPTGASLICCLEKD